MHAWSTTMRRASGCGYTLQPEVEEKIRLIEEALYKKYGEMDNMRWHAIKFLEFDQVVIDDHPLDHIADSSTQL